MFKAIFEHAFIDIALGIDQDSLALHLTLLELTFVKIAIREVEPAQSIIL
jgi:hypothetical protein